MPEAPVMRAFISLRFEGEVDFDKMGAVSAMLRDVMLKYGVNLQMKNYPAPTEEEDDDAPVVEEDTDEFPEERGTKEEKTETKEEDTDEFDEKPETKEDDEETPDEEVDERITDEVRQELAKYPYILPAVKYLRTQFDDDEELTEVIQQLVQEQSLPAFVEIEEDDVSNLVTLSKPKAPPPKKAATKKPSPLKKKKK